MSESESHTNTGAYFRELYDSLVENLHKELARLGYGEITPSHGLIFQYLDEQGSRITRLANRAGITKQSMSALIYQLETLGYLERAPDPEDGRAILFVLTPKGVQLRMIAKNINRVFEQQWEDVLGSEKYGLLRTMLMKLTDQRKYG